MAFDIDETLETPTVLLLGASSQVGVFAIPQLILAGFRVLAVSRRGKPEGYPEFGQVEWMTADDVVQSAQSCQHLLSTGPLELAKKFLKSDNTDSDQASLESAVVFSSSSVESKQNSEDLAEKSGIQNMLNLESDIQLEAERRGVKLVILRPTLIYGCGLDTNVTRLADWIRSHGYMPVNGKADGLRQPVHAEDLASVAISAMLSDKALPTIMYLTGGETLTYTDMIKKIFKALDKPAKLVPLPQWFFVFLIRFSGGSRFAKGTNAEMVKRQRTDLVFDDEPARSLLYYNPRPFAPLEKDFLLPDF